MKILAVYNIKGGVGKTTTAVNLAYLSARQKRRTLIWDLDPQGASSFYFRVKPRIRSSLKKVINSGYDLSDSIKATDYDHLDLLPADFSYRKIDVVFDQQKKRTAQLIRLLRPLADDYDLVILDCPPSLSLISDNIFKATDVLLVPVIPTTLSVNTLQQLLRHARQEKHHFEINAFFSMADRRKSMHQDIIRSLPDVHKEMMDIVIPYNSAVEKMGTYRAPLATYAYRSPAAAAYEDLWQKVSRSLGLV